MDDTGYDLSDPKHPTYHDRMADVWDSREKVRSLTSEQVNMVVAHDEGEHIDAPREFCPECDEYEREESR